jgi:hypothetical protein
MIRIFVLLFLGLSGPLIFAQQRVDDKRIGNWNVLNVQYAFAPRWGVWGELQTRLQSPFYQLFYYEQKGGIWHNINQNFQVLAGTGHYGTHDYKNFDEGPTLREFRLWQQLTVHQYLSRLKFEHRYRIEQRILNGKFADRFRYRLSIAVPLNEEKLQAGTFFLSLFNEIFLSTQQPHFQRNRAYAGLGYIFNSNVSFLIGWIHQYNYNLQEAGAKNNLSLNLNITLRDKSDFPVQIPGGMD